MAERPVLDAIVFDVGGTLVRLDFEWIASMLAGLGVTTSPAALRRAEIEGRRTYDAALRAAGPGGRPANEPYWGGMLAAAGCPDALAPEALARMHERQVSEHLLWAKPAEGAREAIDEVAALGVRVACVSNSDGRALLHLERFGLERGIEFLVDSAEVGVEKPDPAIFRIALDRLGLPAERALYVGDLLGVDEAGARAAGMRFVLIDPFGDYATDSVPRIPAITDLARHVAGTYAVPAGERRSVSSRS